jgi:CubicO group peptidase (beta-lactamase class C family)
MSTTHEGKRVVSAAWADRAQALDRVIDLAIAQQQLVGALVLVSLDAETVYARATGLADREAARPMRLETLFRYSSLTKPIVTAAALALVGQGKLELHQPISQYLPGFRPRLPSDEEPVITLHHLLTHTAGLSYPFMGPADSPYHRAGIADGIGPSGITLEENVRRIAAAPLLFAPGTSWQYSVGLDVTGAVIERVSGEPLPAVVARLVTAPLGMRDTAFHVVDPQRLAAAYADATPVPALMGEPHDLTFGAGYLRYSPGRAFDASAFPSGGAGMVGSAMDFLRFLETIRTGGGPILPPEQAAQMLRNQTGEVAVELLGPGWKFGYGGALLMDPSAAQSPQSRGTWLWGGVYGHSWFVDPVKKLTVVTATNTGVAGMNGPVTIEIRNAAYGLSSPGQ